MDLYIVKNKFPIVLLTIFLVLGNLSLFSQDTIPKDYCINREEIKLFNRINEYRMLMNLPKIVLSKSLCYVAKQHVIDLATNKPDTMTCNFHSWSNKGNWQACCYERDSKDKKCMISKPGELTNYKGHGHEIVYWENRNISANTVFEVWRETNASKAVIINMKEWEEYSWKAIGIGIKNGFASAWFGEEEDTETTIPICNSNEVIEYEKPKEPVDSLLVSTPKNRFYLIIGSFSNIDDAKIAISKHQKEGYKKAKIILKDDKVRISLSDHSTNEGAHNAKKLLPVKYKDAWVLPF